MHSFTTLSIRRLAVLAAVAGSVAAAHGQTTISTTDRYSYAANAGWLDLRPSAADGIRVTDTLLAGDAYAANFGWIHFGDGSPDNRFTYSNTSATDSGVNIAPDGRLTGYAYAANIGWINFEQTHGLPKLDLRTGKFTGSAYSGNLGWISLDTTLSNLATVGLSRPDSDGDGLPDAWEFLQFGNLTTANATSDKDSDGVSDLSEYRDGTSPQDWNSKFMIVSHSFAGAPAQAAIQFTSVPTRNYRIEYDNDLAGAWTDSGLGTFQASGATTTGSLAGLPISSRRFFRVVAVPLPSMP